jgi:transposase
MLKRTDEEKSGFVKDYQTSGMGLKAYACEKGIGISTLSKWVRRYARANSAAERSPSCAPPFVELVAAEDEFTKAGTVCSLQGIEIVLPSQIVIKVGSLLPEAFVVLVQGLSHADPRP